MCFFIKEVMMQYQTTLNGDSNHQQLRLTANPMKGLLLSCGGAVKATVNQAHLKQSHPEVEFIGLVGFDKKRQQFVFLHLNNDPKTTYQDKMLSEREHEVLELVAAGCTNTQIARRLVIAENTVKVHLRHIFEKLKVQSRIEAAMFAVQQGWVTVA
jgi:DNA-binding NarL/FixJ family response regulator